MTAPFRHTFEGMIWSVRVDPASPYMALEVRYKDRKEVSFYSIDPEEKRVIPVLHEFDEKWLWGIECIREGIIVLHSYVSAQTPEHQYLVAYDAASGEKAWENYTDCFYADHREGILSYPKKIQPKRLQLRAIRSGELIRPVDDLSEFRSIPLSLHYPVVDEESSCDILEYGLQSIRCQPEDGEWVLRIEQEGEGEIYRDTLGSYTGKALSSTFFLFENHLIYIKNKSEFVCLQMDC
jgi:hypothetical protein